MSGRSPLRLTRRGNAVLGAAVVLGVASFATGYGEFIALALVAAVIVLMALAIPRVASSVEFRRIDTPRQACRGQMIDLTLTADARRATPPIKVTDQLGGHALPMELPATNPGLQTVVRYRVQPLRRGVQQLGPIHEERTDPFGLATRTLTHQIVDEIVVHPVIHLLRPATPGKFGWDQRLSAHTMTVDPVAEFRSLREYVPGDNERLIHWPSSARSAVPLVRDLHEQTAPALAVLLETLDTAATEVLFEDAVEIAASIVAEALARKVSVTVRTRDRAASGRPTSLRHRGEAFDLFARVNRTSAATTLPSSAVVAGEPGAQIVLIAGAGSPLIPQMAATTSISPRLIVLRLTDGSAPLGPLPVRHIDLVSAEQFAALWNGAALDL